MKATNHGWKDMRCLKVEVISRTVQICWHQANCWKSVLGAIRGCHLESSDFCDGVRLVRRLQRTSEQILFLNGLRREPGIDTGGSEKQQFLAAVSPRRMNNVRLNREIVAQELGWTGGVGEYATNFCGRQENEFGLLFAK